ncbi:MAG: glucosaminidase domain-containing protein, partial [Apilactobacillus sp.]|nr:glucosaminidase domain-containing protein [Apilactobacillus sp.]
ANDVQRRYNILVSISLAQAILESNWGTSQLSSQYNNLYGVKATGNVPSVNLSTQEFVNGEFITITGRFRVYDSWSESVESHALLLVNGTDWNHNQYKDVLDSDNYVAAAKGLQADGYATDPTYTSKIIEIIKKYKLYQYDKQTNTTGGSSNETTGR